MRSDSVELYTGPYAKAKSIAGADSELDKLEDSAQVASKLGLAVIAGGGLSYQNVSRVVEIEEVSEVCIGHHVISRALFIGLEEAVREMIALVR
jgi:pyridoxine 5-phosphate synthase